MLMKQNFRSRSISLEYSSVIGPGCYESHITSTPTEYTAHFTVAK
jgi:hypothetical protein